MGDDIFEGKNAVLIASCVTKPSCTMVGQRRIWSVIYSRSIRPAVMRQSDSTFCSNQSELFQKLNMPSGEGKSGTSPIVVLHCSPIVVLHCLPITRYHRLLYCTVYLLLAADYMHLVHYIICTVYYVVFYWKFCEDTGSVTIVLVSKGSSPIYTALSLVPTMLNAISHRSFQDDPDSVWDQLPLYAT